MPQPASEDERHNEDEEGRERRSTEYSHKSTHASDRVRRFFSYLGFEYDDS